MANTHVALQTLDMTCLEHIFHQTVCLKQTERVLGINGDDACSILTTVLEHCQRIINRLLNRYKTGDTENTAHAFFL